MRRLTEFKDPDFISQGYMMPGDKKSLKQASLETNLNWTLDIFNFLKKEPDYAIFLGKVGPDCAKLFIEKQLFLELEIIVHSYNRRLAVKRAGGKYWKKPVKVYDRNLFLLLKFVKKDDEIIFRLVANKKALLKSYFHSIGNRFTNTKKILFQKESVLGVDIVEGVSLENRRSELFWWDEISPSPSRVLCVFENNILYKGQIKAILEARSKGVSLYRTGRLIDVDFVKSFWSNNFFSNFIHLDWDVIKINLLIPKISIPRFSFQKVHFDLNNSYWLKDRINSWTEVTDWWECFFIKNNIKFWLFCDEESGMTIAKRAAMDRVGGVTLFKQRSETIGYFGWLGAGPAHIAFAFNTHAEYSMKEERNRNNYVIPVGYTFGGVKNSYLYESEFLRSRVSKNGAKFVVAFFDNAFTVMQDISKEQMIELYSKLLKWVVDDSSAGLIIKSKFGSFVSTIIDSIPNLWLQAILSGRVYCVDEYKMLPIIVSKASDLTIGTGISTAAMESAIAELKTLYYYPASTGNHYLEKKMSNVLVFKDVDKLMEAVISIQRGDENLGDTGSMASIMNPYKDEKGPERISIVINALMNSNNKEQFSKIIKSLILQFEHNRSA